MFKDYNSQFSNKCCNAIQTVNEPPFYISDPFYYQRYLDSVPPKEAIYYFPKGNEIIIENAKKPSRSLRRIYMNTKFTQFEIKGLTEYNKIITQSGYIIPDFWTDADNVRFIYSTNFDLKKRLTKCVHI